MNVKSHVLKWIYKYQVYGHSDDKSGFNWIFRIIEMLEIVLAVVVLYWCVIWYLRSQKIQRNHGDLYVVVTGCDSGFGQELAYRLDNEGFNVFAACLTENAASELNRSTSDRLKTVIVDITKSEDITQLLEIVKKSLPHEKALWGVVNNAGVAGHLGFCDVLSREQYIETLDVNLFGMIEMNRQFLPLLRLSKGRIVNTSSVAGRLAAGNPCYTISKYGVEGYSDCLRRELYIQGVSVHIIEPGSFATPLVTTMTKDKLLAKFQKVMDQATKEQREFYGPEYIDAVAELFTEVAIKSASKDTYKVVDAYFHALTSRFPKERYIVGIDANTAFRILWTVPEWMSDLLFAYVGIGKLRPAALKKDV